MRKEGHPWFSQILDSNLPMACHAQYVPIYLRFCEQILVPWLVTVAKHDTVVLV
jgi:hypothetical protein